jgi:hypothetical protein
MFKTIVGARAVGAGAASRYGSGSGSGSDQKMRLLAAPAPQHCYFPYFSSIFPFLPSPFRVLISCLLFYFFITIIFLFLRTSGPSIYKTFYASIYLPIIPLLGLLHVLTSMKRSIPLFTFLLFLSEAFLYYTSRFNFYETFYSSIYLPIIPLLGIPILYFTF